MAPCSVTPTPPSQADTIVAGTLNNVMPLVRNFLFTTEDEIFATGWRNEFTLSDEWSMVADISYSKATRDQLQPEINAQYVHAAGERHRAAQPVRHGHVPAAQQQQHAVAVVPA